MKVVLDANVILAGFCFGGLCRALIEICVESHEVVISEHLLDEVHRHLIQKMGHTPEQAKDRVDWLRVIATIVEPKQVAMDACRDSDDLPILGTLVSGNADCLVTSDKDLLVLETFNGHPILSPRRFWERLKP